LIDTQFPPWRSFLDQPTGGRRPRALRVPYRRVPTEPAAESLGAPGSSKPREGLSGKKSKGVIRSTVWIGSDGTVRKHWKRVADAAKHPVRALEPVAAGMMLEPVPDDRRIC
jgi:hypothetical protein